MGAIRAKVAARALGAGDRLPSIRSLAATMGVSPSTVVEAYDRLAADGLIRARRGSGFYVSSAVTSPLALAEVEPRRDREVDPFWVSRQSLDTDDAVPKPGCGWLPPEWMPEAALRRATRALARTDASVLTN
ncbi:GntR family transcriptional regulator, partial [Bradyrhizobium japonicum]